MANRQQRLPDPKIADKHRPQEINITQFPVKQIKNSKPIIRQNNPNNKLTDLTNRFNNSNRHRIAIRMSNRLQYNINRRQFKTYKSV